MDTQGEKLLIVAGEPLISSLADSLRDAGYSVVTSMDVESAAQVVGRDAVDLVLYDLQMSGENGFEFINRARRASPEVPFLIITPFWSMEKAIQALEVGAENYITTPLNDNAVKLQIAKALEKKKLGEENRRLKQKLGLPDLPGPIQANKVPARVAANTGNNTGASSPRIQSLKKALEDPERKIILEALKAFNFNRQETARALRINRTTLYNKMKRLGLLGRKARGINRRGARAAR